MAKDIKNIKAAKKAGIKKEDCLKVMLDSAKKAAKAEGWRPSELASTLAYITQRVNFVYGK